MDHLLGCAANGPAWTCTRPRWRRSASTDPLDQDIQILRFAGQPGTATAARDFYQEKVVREATVLLLRKIP